VSDTLGNSTVGGCITLRYRGLTLYTVIGCRLSNVNVYSKHHKTKVVSPYQWVEH